MLGGIHGLIGVMNEGHEILVRPHLGNTGADGDFEGLVTGPEMGLLDRFPQVFGAPAGVLDRHAGHQNGELFPAVTGHDIAATHVLQQRDGDVPEKVVSPQVPVGIVDAFEVIDVHNGDRERALRRLEFR